MDSAAIVDNQPTQVTLQGDVVKEGDWVVWVRADQHSDCSSALSNSSTVAGGLVYDAGGGVLKVDVSLDGEKDGVADPDPHDGVQEIGVCLEEPSHMPASHMPASYMPASTMPTGVQEIAEGLVEEASSTFMMCHASPPPGTTYAAQTDGEWQEPEKDVQVQRGCAYACKYMHIWLRTKGKTPTCTNMSMLHVTCTCMYVSP